MILPNDFIQFSHNTSIVMGISYLNISWELRRRMRTEKTLSKNKTHHLSQLCDKN